MSVMGMRYMITRKPFHRLEDNISCSNWEAQELGPECSKFSIILYTAIMCIPGFKSPPLLTM